MSAVNIPQKAGFVPTPDEWDQLVRIAENLAAQLAQAQAERDAAHAEVARLTNVIGFIEGELEMSIGVGPFWDVMHDVHLFKGSLIDLCLAKLPEALRQPAPAPAQDAARDAMVKLLERALEELAQAQAERDAAREHAERQQLSKDGLYRELREVSSQRDAARAEVARLTAERAAMLNVKTTEGLTASEWLVRTAKAEAEVARLKEEVEGAYEAHNEAVTILERRLETYKEAADDVLKALPAVAINEMEEILCASNTALVRKALAYLWHCAAREGLRQPAPAGGEAR